MTAKLTADENGVWVLKSCSTKAGRNVDVYGINVNDMGIESQIAIWATIKGETVHPASDYICTIRIAGRIDPNWVDLYPPRRHGR